MIIQRFAFFTLILFSTISILTQSLHAQDAPAISSDTVNDYNGNFYSETQVNSQENGITVTIREGDTLIPNYKQLGLVDQIPKNYHFQPSETPVSDNKQEIDQEWFSQTSKSINIMSKVFDHVMKEAFADGYQQSGFFNKGCQGFWIPNQGVMFQLQVNFPLVEKPDQIKNGSGDELEDDLWNQFENQLTGKETAIDHSITKITYDSTNTDRTEELQNLIIDTISKYGAKFDSMGDDESIMVMVHGPQVLSYMSLDLIGHEYPEPTDKNTYSLALDLVSTPEPSSDTLLDDYETELKKLHNKYESDQLVASRWKEALDRLSQQHDAGVITKDQINEKEIQIIEIRRKLKDTRIDMEALQKKITALKEQTKEESDNNIDIKNHYESLIQEKVVNELKKMISEENFKIQVDAVFDWGNSTITNIHIDADRPAISTKIFHEEDYPIRKTNSPPGIVSNIQDHGIGNADSIPGVVSNVQEDGVAETSNTTIEEVITNNSHPWKKTLTEVKDGKVKEIDITITLNDDPFTPGNPILLNQSSNTFQVEENNNNSWTPEKLNRFEYRLRHNLSLPNFANEDFPPVHFNIKSESFKGNEKPKTPSFRRFYQQPNANVHVQPLSTNKTMIMQIPFKDLNPKKDIFQFDENANQSEDHVKDAFRITIY